MLCLHFELLHLYYDSLAECISDTVQVCFACNQFFYSKRLQKMQKFDNVYINFVGPICYGQN